MRFVGYIADISEVGFKIIQASGVADGSQSFGEISVGLTTAREYQSTVSETTDELGSTVTALQIHFAGFVTCAIFAYNWDSKLPTYQM